jgi:hypothetical protein
VQAAEEYRSKLWAAYEKRVSLWKMFSRNLPYSK